MLCMARDSGNNTCNVIQVQLFQAILLNSPSQLQEHQVSDLLRLL